MKFSEIRLCVLVGLTGFMVLWAQTSARATITTTGHRVMIQPAKGETIDQLRQQGITRVDNYGSYWLAEVNAKQLADLKATHGDRVVDADYLNLIELRGATIDVRAGEPPVTPDMQEVETTGRRLRIVQFKGPIRPQWLAELKGLKGLQIITYVPNNGYLVFMDAQTEKKVQAMRVPDGPVQWIGAFHPDYKMTEGLKNTFGVVDVKVAVVDSPEGRLDLQEIETYTERSSPEPLEILNQLEISARVNAAALTTFARMPSVLWIDPVIPIKKMDEIQGLILAGHTNGPGHGPAIPIPAGQHYFDFLTNSVAGPMTNAFFDPTTYPIVGIDDSGFSDAPIGVRYTPNGTNGLTVAGQDYDFYTFGNNYPYRVAYESEDVSCGDFYIAQVMASSNVCISSGTVTWEDMAGFPHGTAIASVIAGYNTNVVDRDYNGFQYGMGISPFGRIGTRRCFSQNIQVNEASTCDYDVYDVFCVVNMPQLMLDDYEDGARIVNNSWGQDLVVGANDGLYSGDCQNYDYGVRDSVGTGATNQPSPFPLNQEQIIVFANGNGGSVGTVGGFSDITVTPPGTAKNVISVGATESVRLDGSACDDAYDSYLMASYSAFGPTRDGRFKPEIVAPGNSIYGVVASFWTNFAAAVAGESYTYGEWYVQQPPRDLEFPIAPPYSPYTNGLYVCGDGYAADYYLVNSGPLTNVLGTSFAAPAVSGGIQLLWWYFQNRLGMLQPSPAMAKAYLLNSARYLPIIYTNTVTGAYAPDTLPAIDQGMGEMDLGRMFDGIPRALRDESSERALYTPLITTNPVPQQTYFTASGQSYQQFGQIYASNVPFRVTVAWSDTPGSSVNSNQLVNNLDLDVVMNNDQNQTYHGNVFQGPNSVTGGTPDTLNPVESVFLPPGGAITAGAPYEVIVKATDITGIGVPHAGTNVQVNQDFALVVYNVNTNRAVLSDAPYMNTNDTCQTAAILSQFPYSWSNALAFPAYHQVQPSSTAGTGGDQEFFVLIDPGAGTAFTADTFGSDFATVLSVWGGSCGELQEIASDAEAGGSVQSAVSWVASGSNSYYIVAEGKDGATGNLKLDVNRQCALVLNPPELPSSLPDASYEALFTVSAGGIPPYTYAVTSGSLPPGLTLQPINGELSGSPTATGVFKFTITVTDAVGCTASVAYTITVACPSLTLSPPSLPSAGVGQPYSQAITASGGQPPVTFTLAVGPMPPGLVLTSSGSVTGTPTAVGVYAFKVSASDSNGCSGTAYYSLNETCPTITIAPTVLPVGQEFTSYGPTNFTASGGTAPYTFSQTGGSLPAGMTLSSRGTLSGTPTSVSSTFTVTATDQYGCAGSATYTLTLIDPNPPVTVIMSPGTLSSGVVGQTYNPQTINATGGDTPYTFAVSSGSLPPGLQANSSGASSFTISGTPTNAGSFAFTVRATDHGGDVGQTNYTISVSSLASLGVSAILSPQTVTIESNLTCTVTVNNSGPSPATGVTISSTLPAGVTFVSSSSGCTADGNTVVCNVGSLPAGSTTNISYLMQATQTGAVSVASSVTAADSVPSSTTASGTVVLPYFVASNPAKIVDPDGDIVTVALKGGGSITEVGLLGSVSNGPIDHINLTGTGPSSSLTISVKKAKGGSGLVNVGSITSDGSFKSINGSAVSVTGAGGIQVAGNLGTLKANALLGSALVVNGSGGIGTLQVNEMSNSVCTVTNGMMKTVNVGVYVDSKINAEAIKTVKLGTVTTENSNQVFGIQVQQPGGTVSVSHPHLNWKIAPSSTQSTNDFQVAQP
ncbi:MAG: putative Ig domain-containing protein [Verrucomicrobiia bacterium]|jgi:uncharacterized repeat protein (TIGR01451 family)